MQALEASKRECPFLNPSEEKDLNWGGEGVTGDYSSLECSVRTCCRQCMPRFPAHGLDPTPLLPQPLRAEPCLILQIRALVSRCPHPARGAYHLGPSPRHSQLRVHREAASTSGAGPDQASGSQGPIPTPEKSRDPGAPIWKLGGCGQAVEMENQSPSPWALTEASPGLTPGKPCPPHLRFGGTGLTSSHIPVAPASAQAQDACTLSPVAWLSPRPDPLEPLDCVCWMQG